MRARIRAGVYQIVNEVNGKSYIGSSIDIDHRWSEHRHGFKRPSAPYRSNIHSAVRKYGIENFTFIVLEECEPIKEVLLEREQHYIDTLKPEYNLLPKAGSRLGSKASAETIEKLRQLTHTEEWKRLASVWVSAYMNDPDVKAKYSELRAGKTFVEIFGEIRAAEIAAKQSENRTGKHVGFDPWNKGIPLTDEQRAKLEAAGFWEMTEEKRKHVSEALLGREVWNTGIPWSDEAKKKMSDSHLGMEPWNKGQRMDEQYCQTASDAAKARFNPDHQALMTEAARQANTGKSRPQDVRDRISASNLASEARKAFSDTRRGVPRSEEVKQAVSEALQKSEKAKEYHQRRIGKSRGNNPSGHYGVIWDKARNKWQVRIQGKMYGRFDRLEDAIAKVEEVLALQNQTDHG